MGYYSKQVSVTYFTVPISVLTFSLEIGEIYSTANDNRKSS